jgi:hypothetical protein
MKLLPKLLLTLAVPSLVMGAIVTFNDIEFAPTRTVALPVGAICVGLFAISWLMQNEVARFDEEERQKIESEKRHESSVSESGENHAPQPPPHPELSRTRARLVFTQQRRLFRRIRKKISRTGWPGAAPNLQYLDGG